MHTHQTPVDISNIPDLVRLVKEVNTAKRPRILKQDNEPVAMLIPLKTTLEHHRSLEMFVEFYPYAMLINKGEMLTHSNCI